MSSGASRTWRGLIVIGAVSVLLVGGILGAGTFLLTVPSHSGPRVVPLFSGSQCTIAIYHETKGNHAIQTAINVYGPLSAPASPVTICIGPGSFPEQLTINHTSNLTILGSGNGSTALAPSTVVGNGDDLDSYLPAYAIIGAWNDSALNISGITVNGTAAQGSVKGNCQAQYFGVYFGKTSGQLNASTVTGISSNGGCQGQNAVYADTGTFETHTVTPEQVRFVNNTVTGFGKNGITCDDVGVTCLVAGNTVSTSPMALGYAATNGIQFWDSAGNITGNTVSGNYYLPGACLQQNYFNPGTGCTSPYWSGGILVLSSFAPVNVSSNLLLANQVGLWSLASPTTAWSNTVAGSGYYGLVLDSSPGTVGAFGVNVATPINGTLGANSIADQNVGLLVYDDNSTIAGNSLSDVNVSIEVATDAGYATTYNVTGNVGSSNVSGALLGNVSSFQSGVSATASGRYVVTGNRLSNVSGPTATALGTGIAVYGASATVDGNTLGAFPNGISVVVGPGGNVTGNGNTVTAPAPALAGSGFYVFAGNASLSGNSVSGYSYMTGAGWWPDSQATGLFAQCLEVCNVTRNTLTDDAIGIAVLSYVYGPFPAPSWPYAAPPSAGPIAVDNNTVTDSGAFGIAFELNQHTASAVATPSVHVMDNSIDNTLSGAVGLMADQGTYWIGGNTFTGTTLTGSSGPSQPTGVGSIGTASIQVLDAYDSITLAYVGGNSFSDTTLYTALLNLTTAPPYFAAIYGAPGLTPPVTPIVSATALDADQPLTVSSAVPTTGVPAYSYSWLVSVNGGAYGSAGFCGTPSASGVAPGTPVSCAVPGGTLVPGNSYVFELAVTDNATAPVTQTSGPSATVAVSGALGTPGAPSVSATALDADQTLVVSDTLPTSGSAPFAWQWMISVNGGGYSAATQCASNSGTGGAAGAPVACTIAGGTLTAGSAYLFELEVTDSATLAETATSAASSTVSVSSALTAPGTPATSATELDLNQALTVSSALPTNGTGPYAWVWMVSVNGGAPAPATVCATNSGSGTGGAPVVCAVAASTLVPGDTYAFSLAVTDAASTPESATSTASATIAVASTLTGPARPFANRPALDVNQVLTVSDHLPTSGTAPYTWRWLVSVNSSAFATATMCAVPGGTGGPSGGLVTCVIAAGTLTVGDYYNFKLTVSDSATSAESRTSLPNAQTVTVSTGLTQPAAPTVSATALDADQTLTVTGTIPSTGTSPYRWTWEVSVNGGALVTATACAVDSGTGGSAGGTVTCSIPGNTLTAGDRYVFKLMVRDGATVTERMTSPASSLVHVRSALTSPTTPSVSYTRMVVGQTLKVNSTLPMTGTPLYTYTWLVSVNGGSYVSSTYCTTNGGTTHGGVTVTCTIPGGTLTSGNTYAFELQITDSATAAETETSAASATVTVA